MHHHQHHSPLRLTPSEYHLQPGPALECQSDKPHPCSPALRYFSSSSTRCSHTQLAQKPNGAPKFNLPAHPPAAPPPSQARHTEAPGRDLDECSHTKTPTNFCPSVFQLSNGFPSQGYPPLPSSTFFKRSQPPVLRDKQIHALLFVTTTSQPPLRCRRRQN